MTGFSPVFAAPLPALEGSLTYTPPVAITKQFVTPEGTEIPDATFKFSFAKYGIGSEGTLTGSMPVIADVELELDSTDPSYMENTSNYLTTIFQEKLIPLSTLNATNGSAFVAGAGQYIYTITETAVVGYPSSGVTLYTHESEAQYELSLYVARDGTAPNPLYIQYITVRKLIDDSGNSLGIAAEKVDPTPGAHGLAFVNTYVKANDGKPGDNEDPDPEDTDFQNLIVEKQEVDGAGVPLATAAGHYFPFQLTLTNADVGETDPLLPTFYKAYVLDAAGDVVNNLTLNGGAPVATVDSNGNRYYDFQVGVPQTLNLQDDQKLVFTRTPVGTKWVAVEKLTGAGSPFDTYTASILVTVNTAMDPVITGVLGQDTTTFDRLVGEGDTNALFKNYLGDTLPLGLDINNLPYYGLILLALLALAAYVVFKARRRRQNAYEFDSYDA
jgi:hypothetical protein